MTQYKTKKELDELVKRWLAGEKGLKINEKVYVLERIVRSLINKKPKVADYP